MSVSTPSIRCLANPFGRELLSEHPETNSFINSYRKVHHHNDSNQHKELKIKFKNTEIQKQVAQTDWKSEIVYLNECKY